TRRPFSCRAGCPCLAGHLLSCGRVTQHARPFQEKPTTRREQQSALRWSPQDQLTCPLSRASSVLAKSHSNKLLNGRSGRYCSVPDSEFCRAQIVQCTVRPGFIIVVTPCCNHGTSLRQ